MERYIEIIINGFTYRFLIDEVLDKELRELLKDNYQFNERNVLIINEENYYIIRRLFLNLLIDNMYDYNISPELREQLESYRNIDNIHLESAIISLCRIYNSYSSNKSQNQNQVYRRVRTKNYENRNLKDIIETTKKGGSDKKDVVVEDSKEEVLDTTSEVEQVSSGEEVLDNTSSETEDVDTATSEEVEDLKETMDFIEEADDLHQDIPTTEIKEVLDRVEVVETEEELESKTGENIESYDLKRAIETKDEKIYLVKDESIEKKLEEVVKVVAGDIKKEKILSYKEQYTTYKNRTNKAFNDLRSKFKVSNLSGRNLNYFGDQFMDTFENICKDTGISAETMFADYFNSYSQNRKYNSPLNKFINQFIKYNGGDDSTRHLLEAMLVKKAVSRGLISYKYNRNLKDEYKNLSVSAGGYINFDRINIANNRVVGNINTNTTITNIARGGIDTNLSIQEERVVRGEDYQSNKIVSEINDDVRENSNPNSIDNVNTNTTVEADTERSQANKNIRDGSKNNNVLKRVSPSGALGLNAVAGLNNPLLNANRFSKLKPKKGGITAKGELDSTGDAVLGFSGKPLNDSDRNNNFSYHGSSLGHKNNTLNPNMYDDEEETNNEENESSVNGDLNGNNEVEGNSKETEKNNPVGSAIRAEVQNQVKKKAKNGIKKFLAKSAFMKVFGKYIIIALAILVVILILLLLILGGDDDMEGMMDGACNYNDTTITVTNCYSGDAEKENIASSISIGDYVKGSLYAYTKGETYSDDTLKAAMIAIKTTALSLGNYSGENKNLTLTSCSSTLKYCSLSEGCSITSSGTSVVSDSSAETLAKASSEYASKLDSIYNSINEYIYVSTSYDTAITSLSQANSLKFDESTLSNFEEKAKSGKDYTAILSETYSKKEDSKTEESNTTNENNSSANTNKVTATNTNTIFVGDSRTYGLYQHVPELTDANTVAAAGYGYNWFVKSGSYKNKNMTNNAKGGGIAGVNSLIKGNTSYNIVMWLGVNDFNYISAQKYIDKYVELVKGSWSNHTIYVLPVGPVNDSIITKTYPHVTTAAINKYNNDLKTAVASAGLNNLKYLNVDFNALNLNANADGLHYYQSGDNQNIYNAAMNAINNGATLSSELKLYKLTDYCVNLTATGLDNDLFWWPVGSEQATGENLYKGPPAATVITSGFGPRNTGIQGASKNHAGIDISRGGGSCGLPAIASKNGTVVLVTDYGKARGTYVKIDHGDGMQTIYQHLIRGSYTVKVGDKVEQGQKIGSIGNTGVGSGCHLHFEILINEVPVNPVEYVSKENPRPVSLKTTGSYTFSGSTDPNIVQSEVCNALQTKYNLNKLQTSIILANLKAESGLNPTIINSIGAYGLGQWLYGRKTDLQNQVYCQGSNCPKYNTAEGQIMFLMHELNSSHAKSYKLLTSASNITQGVEDFCNTFEVPGRSICYKRARNLGNINVDSISNYVNNGCK